MGSAYGINNCVFWLPLGAAGSDTDLTVFDSPWGLYSDTGQTYISSDGAAVASAFDWSGGTTPNTSGSQVYATASGSAQPTLHMFGRTGDPDGSQPQLLFSTSNYLTLPSSAAIGNNGTTANEGTIIICARVDPTAQTNGGVGYPFVIGGSIGLYFSATNTINAYNGSVNAFPNAFNFDPFKPQCLALRFSSTAGAVGAAQTKFYAGQKFSSVINSNLLSGSKTGGTINNSAGSYSLAMGVSEFLMFNVALTDAQIFSIMQAIQDRVCPGWTDSAQVLFFGDSRAIGYTPNSGTFTNEAYARQWPRRCLSQVGGYATSYNQGVSGNTIAQQQTVFATNAALLSSSSYGKCVCVGEIGVNDIRAGTTAANIEYGGTSGTGTSTSPATGSLLYLCNYMLAHGATNVVAMTIAPSVSGSLQLTSSQETVRQAVNAWMTTPGNLPPGVTVCDNASDARLTNIYYMASDGLHPNDAGYGVYSQNAAKTLKKVLGLSGGIVLPVSLNGGIAA